MSSNKKVGVAILIVFIGIQLIQPARNNSEQMMLTDISHTYSFLQHVQAVLKTACYDCHSNNTRYPWYAYVQPAGWLLAKHVRQGKADLNFSEFGSYPRRKQMSKLRAIENSMKDNTMPLPSYTLIHPDARLTKNDKAVIIDWVTKAEDSLTAKN